MKPELIIVGAGLNGLLLAYLLQSRYRITLLEAQPRIGGRILTVEAAGEYYDLGPTWIWPHQHHIRHLIDSLGLTLFRHYDRGTFAYDAPEGVQYFHTGQTAPSYRIDGGAAALTDTLFNRLDSIELHSETAVIRAVSDEEGVTLFASERAFRAPHCIFTLPPRLCAETIAFEPPMPDSMKTQMAATPTWMGFSAKCVVTYAEPFWRDRGLSGFATSHIGPLSEVHDASGRSGGALFGFYHTRTADDSHPDRVIAQLARLFGPAAYGYEAFRYHSWRSDPYTSVDADREALHEHPRYGLTAAMPRIAFSGTETSYEEGGYLEGAVIAAMRLAKKFLEN